MPREWKVEAGVNLKGEFERRIEDLDNSHYENVMTVPTDEMKKMVEEGRISVRNMRRDGNDEIKRAEKDGRISEDASRKAQNEMQKLTDKHIEMMDGLLSKKEAEIMEV